jgi:hypothetical protein
MPPDIPIGKSVSKMLYMLTIVSGRLFLKTGNF